MEKWLKLENLQWKSNPKQFSQPQYQPLLSNQDMSSLGEISFMWASIIVVLRPHGLRDCDNLYIRTVASILKAGHHAIYQRLMQGREVSSNATE